MWTSINWYVTEITAVDHRDHSCRSQRYVTEITADRLSPQLLHRASAVRLSPIQHRGSSQSAYRWPYVGAVSIPRRRPGCWAAVDAGTGPCGCRAAGTLRAEEDADLAGFESDCRSQESPGGGGRHRRRSVCGHFSATLPAVTRVTHSTASLSRLFRVQGSPLCSDPLGQSVPPDAPAHRAAALSPSLPSHACCWPWKDPEVRKALFAAAEGPGDMEGDMEGPRDF